MDKKFFPACFFSTDLIFIGVFELDRNRSWNFSWRWIWKNQNFKIQNGGPKLIKIGGIWRNLVSGDFLWRWIKKYQNFKIQNGGSNMADRNYKKLDDFDETWCPELFWVAESKNIRILKFKMADSIWQTEITKNWEFWWNLVSWAFLCRWIEKWQQNFKIQNGSKFYRIRSFLENMAYQSFFHWRIQKLCNNSK